MFFSKGFKVLGATIVPILIFSQTVMASPSLITYQNAAGQNVIVNYLNMLSTGGAMRTAFINALTTSESNGTPIYITDTSKVVVNYAGALNKAETYQTALNDSTLNKATAPVATQQMNTDGSVTPITSAVTVTSVSAVNGTVTVNLSSAPTATPVIADFAVTNGTTAVVPSAISTVGTVVTLTVPAIAATTAAQSIVYNVSYKTATAVAAPAFTVPPISTSALQIVGTPKANVLLGTLTVTVNDQTLVNKVMVDGVAVVLTPLNNVYTVPITDTTDNVVFYDAAGNQVVAQKGTWVAPASALQIVGTPKANVLLGTLTVTVNDQTLVNKVMVDGVAVVLTPLNNVYTVPITDTTDNVVFYDTAGNQVVAQKGTWVAPGATVLSFTNYSYNSLLGFIAVTVNDSSLVKTVTLDGVSYTMGAAAGADNVAASVVDATHIKVMGLGAAPSTVVLVSTSGLSVTVK